VNNGYHNRQAGTRPGREAVVQRTAPRGVRPVTSYQTPVSVYVARYIIFLVTYLILLGVSVLFITMVLRVNVGESGLTMLTEAPRTASQAPSSSAMQVVDEEEYVRSAISSLTFKLDLSEYEQYMNPADRDAYIKLINQTHELDKDYKPDDLTSVPYVRDGVQTPYLRLYAAKALEAMLKEAYAEGCSTTLTVTSCYRSYDYQQYLYDYRVSVYAYLGEEEARKKAATIVALPGQSEHQSGLAADIHTLISADVNFEDTFEAQWLKENSWKFGFIVRYPLDKIDITGISFEPWHYRYVGRYHAFKIYESGLSLEEYCEKTGLGLQ